MAGQEQQDKILGSLKTLIKGQSIKWTPEKFKAEILMNVRVI